MTSKKKPQKFLIMVMNDFVKKVGGGGGAKQTPMGVKT